MIELPDSPSPNGIEVVPIDYGFPLRSPAGASTLRVNRPGSRFQVQVSFPPMKPDVARKFLPRFLRGQKQGLRIEYPLLGLNPGSPGDPVVDGAVTAMTSSLPLRGLTPGYALQEGHPLTLIDAYGYRYLHFCATAGRADASGELVADIEPAIRAPLANGAAVLIAKPTIEGLVIDNPGWSLSLDQLIRGGTISIEEAR